MPPLPDNRRTLFEHSYQAQRARPVDPDRLPGVHRAARFSFALIQASRIMGSLLDVALYLGVEPKQVFDWIADLDRPSSEQLPELENRLRAITARSLAS